MILTVNLGNTHITIGGYEHDDLKFCGRLHTDPAATVDEYGLRLLNLLSLHGASPEQIEGGILGSVVPALTGRVLAALQMLCPVRILTVGPGLKSGIRLRLDNPAQLGAELLCGAVAALAEGSGPLVVISADTAISLMAVNGKQELVGGVILPGPQLSLAALVQNTAQLPQIDLSAPAPASVLGKNTAACLQNGFVLGTAGMLDGLADHFCAELGPETKFYATGNLPIPIREACCTPILYRETLITDGLYRIWMKNKKGLIAGIVIDVPATVTSAPSTTGCAALPACVAALSVFCAASSFFCAVSSALVSSCFVSVWSADASASLFTVSSCFTSSFASCSIVASVS